MRTVRTVLAGAIVAAVTTLAAASTAGAAPVGAGNTGLCVALYQHGAHSVDRAAYYHGGTDGPGAAPGGESWVSSDASFNSGQFTDGISYCYVEQLQHVKGH